MRFVISLSVCGRLIFNVIAELKPFYYLAVRFLRLWTLNIQDVVSVSGSQWNFLNL